jgi:predicted transcriptional regulator
MVIKDVIKELGGPASLAKETNIPRRTLYAYRDGSRRKVSGPTKLLFKILLAHHRDGTLKEILKKALEIEIKEDKQ